MSETGLSLTRNDLRQSVGWFAGFGLDYTAYSADQLTSVDRCIDIGLRKFYTPIPLPGDRHSHQWSFLKPIKSISLVANQIDYDLPEEFAGLVGDAYLSSDDLSWSRIPQVNVSRMLALRQREADAVTGVPSCIAVTVIESDGATPTRYTLQVYPTPDDGYTLRLEMRVNPYQLSATAAYPLGGQPHAETLREACLAAWEQNANDERGIHTMEFMERLVASVHYDRRAMGPKSYGYNGDPSVRGGHRRGSGPYCDSAIYTTYNGEIPG